MAKKTKLSEPTWAIAWKPYRKKRCYHFANRHIKLFRTRADAYEALREGPEWVQEISKPVRVDVTER